MKRSSWGSGALVGGLLTVSLTGLLYLGREAAGLPFVPYDLFNWVVRELPGGVVTFGIDVMIDGMLLLGISVVDTAKTAERMIAVLQFLMGGAVAGAFFFGVMAMRRIRAPLFGGSVMSGLFGLPMIAVSMALTQSTVPPILIFLYLAGLFLAWGIALGLACDRLVPVEQAPSAYMPAPVMEKLARRRFLIRLGATTATITVVSGAVSAVLATAERRRQEALAAGSGHQAQTSSGSLFPNANDPVVHVPGTRPEYTPLKDHYKVFLQTEPTVIEGASWKLPITGLVDRPLMLTIDDFRSRYEPRHQYVTLTCISGRVGTGLISTTLWTGAGVADVLADAGVRDGARYLSITCGDGFYETMDLDLVAADDRIMFCYAWDGNPLPSDHGFPLRIWIPDRYGMKQPKWITGIEVTDEYRDGYWVERNWDRVARVKATSVIDTVAVDHLIENGNQMLVPVGGIAYAGTRGISQVEVRVDGGPWQPAQLRTPLSETTWVIWRYEWPFAAGNHTFEVRCAEGDGTRQIEVSQDARPDGSSGLDNVEASL